MQALWQGICPQKCLQESQEGKKIKINHSAVVAYSSASRRFAAVAVISLMDQETLACIET